jgi:hypothetical protein
MFWTVDGESFLDEVSNLFFRPRLHIESALDFATHTESRCSVRDVGVVPGQQFATAHLSLIGVNSEKQRVTKTLTRNVVRLGGDRLATILATPTRTRRRALDLLGVTPTA